MSHADTADADSTTIPPSPPHRSLCTDCGVSRTDDPKRCGRACQFIKPNYPTLERTVHGRTADPARDEERFFGVYQSMQRAVHSPLAKGAQWTGITTAIAERLLESGTVDAVITLTPDPDDRWRGIPTIITNPADMARARGMRMGYAPLVAEVERAISNGHHRLAVIAIPCQVYAIRALEAEWRTSHGLDTLFVIGTPCSDNTTTDNFWRFLALLSPEPETITYLEFRADYHVELRFEDGTKCEIPFLKLPLSDLPPDFFPLTCRTCVDYTNRLADITVGYMAGSGDQWLLVRNARGQAMVDHIADCLEQRPLEDKGRRAGAVKGFIANTRRAAGGLPLRSMPDWARPIAAWLQPRIGPRGVEFARARLEMKAAETVLHLRHKEPARMKHMIPQHVWDLVRPYGLSPCASEAPPDSADPNKSP